METVAVSASFARDRTLFAATRDGLHRSRDAGESWQHVLAGSRVFTVAVSPAPTESALFVGTEDDGVLRSGDGGQSWSGVNAGLLDLTVLALALSPRFEADRMAFAATASGLYRSRNGAKSWRAIDLSLDDPAVQCLAVSPGFAEDGVVLAGTEGEGLLRSEDAGGTWEVVPELAERAVTAIAFSTRYPGRQVVAVTTDGGVAVSRDGGASWSPRGDPGPVLSLLFIPDGDKEILLAGLPGGGVVRSTDEGASWTPANDGLRASLLAGLTCSPAFSIDQTLFAAGLGSGVTISTDGGQIWAARNDGLEDMTVLGLVPSSAYARDRTLYATTTTGIYRSRDGAATWELALGEVVPTTLGALAALPGPHEGSSRVLAAVRGGRLVASDDGGDSWSDLGRGFGGAEIVAIATSPEVGRDRTIFVGTSGGRPGDDAGELVLWRSTDAGGRWERWLETRGPSLLPLAVPPSYPRDGVVFAGLGGRVMKPIRGAQEVVARTRRPLWRGVEVDREPVWITALAAPSDGALFAATSAGVYVSRDGGRSFEPWSEGLTHPSILTLAISPSYPEDRLVFAVGLDGTIWRRRDG